MLARLSPRQRLLLTIVLVVVLVPLATLVETGFVLFVPGAASDLSTMIVVEGAAPSAGTFLMMTVLARRATPGLVVYGLLHPGISVYHQSQIVPEGMDLDEYQEYTRLLMAESQDVAVLVALRQLELGVSLGGDGVEVSAVVPGGRWQALAREDGPDLRVGDVITEAGGLAVNTVDDLLAVVGGARDAGEDRIPVIYGRSGVARSTSLPLDLLPDHALDTGLLAVRAGILLKTVSPAVGSPVEVEIDAGGVGGPSAGLMFVLEIVNQLTPVDLTAGAVVAGTGAVSELGEVLPVGGVRQKVLAAREAGAAVFLVPRWHEAEARRAARGIEIVPVDGVADALDYLRQWSRGACAPAAHAAGPGAAGPWLTPAGPGSYN